MPIVSFTRSANTGIAPLAGGVQAPDFRDSLGDRNIFINADTYASTKPLKRVKEIIVKELSPGIDDALAEKLAITAESLETKIE